VNLKLDVKKIVNLKLDVKKNSELRIIGCEKKMEKSHVVNAQSTNLIMMQHQV